MGHSTSAFEDDLSNTNETATQNNETPANFSDPGYYLEDNVTYDNNLPIQDLDKYSLDSHMTQPFEVCDRATLDPVSSSPRRVTFGEVREFRYSPERPSWRLTSTNDPSPQRYSPYISNVPDNLIKDPPYKCPVTTVPSSDRVLRSFKNQQGDKLSSRTKAVALSSNSSTRPKPISSRSPISKKGSNSKLLSTKRSSPAESPSNERTVSQSAADQLPSTERRMSNVSDPNVSSISYDLSDPSQNGEWVNQTRGSATPEIESEDDSFKS